MLNVVLGAGTPEYIIPTQPRHTIHKSYHVPRTEHSPEHAGRRLCRGDAHLKAETPGKWSEMSVYII